MDPLSATRRLPALLSIALAFFLLPGPAAPVLARAGLAGPAAASSPTAAAPLPSNLAWGWPLAGTPAVIHGFDPPSQPWLSGHRGVDLAADQGTAVIAPVEAVVSFSGVVVNREVLTLTTADGLRLSFEPVNSTLGRGDTVVRGQTIGVVSGPTHCDGIPGASCLHWGVRRGETYLDPLAFLMDLRPSVLLPLVIG